MSLILTLLIILNIQASAVPENSLSIPVTNKDLQKEESFHKIIDKLENIYRPYIESHGVPFELIRNWESGTVNASASKRDGVYKIKVYGGLYRFSPVTDDSFLLVLCHEIGHLIGGAPTIKPFNISSSEGQADYFSTSKCFRKVIRGEDHASHIKDSPIHPLVLRECKISFRDDSEDYMMCLRVNVANVAMARTSQEIQDNDFPAKFDTPDPYIRRLIHFNGYPNPQCRLDILFAGSLCDVDSNIDTDFNQELYNKGNCSVQTGHTRGLRPRCWYVPRDDV